MWYFPPRPFIASQVLDVDELNISFSALQAELSGLTEQNFKADALVGAEAKWAKDIGIQVRQVSSAIDPFDATAIKDVTQSTSWVPVDAMTKTFTWRGGKVLCIASFSMSTLDLPLASKQTGNMFCFEIDGTPYLDAMIGSGDQTNDFVGSVSNRFGGTPANDPETGPCFRGFMLPFVLELVTFLPPGEHTVRLVTRKLDLAEANIYNKVASQELLVVGMNCV